MYSPKELEELRDLNRNRKLIPFVGAGLSARLGLPTWSSLIDTIAEDLQYDPEVFKLSGNELQLAEFYVVNRGIGSLRSQMDRNFNPSDDKIKSSRAHSALVEMKPHLIYTTNYDCIIERAFKLKNVNCQTIANIDDIAKAVHKITQIVKFHGSFNDDASLVLTESSYFDRLDFESPIDIKLRADMLGKCLLFIGYSLSDINIRYMLYKLHKLRQKAKLDTNRKPSAYLTTFGVKEIQKSLLAQWGVVVVELDPSDKEESINNFLEALI